VVAVESGDFVEFRKKVFNLYREGNYSKALEIAENYSKDYKTFDVYQDKTNPNVFFFYIEDK
jgi:hypothetical protein